jgi:hypothetical protein
MASTYTPLGIEKQATGENAGTWGTKTNTNLEIVEQAIGGKTILAYAKADDASDPNIVSVEFGGDVVDDTTPQLGGNLDTNSFMIDFDDDHGIRDENGNEQLQFQTTASAVNHFDITNAATGNSPTISAVGGDSNIDLTLVPKGTGVGKLTNANGTSSTQKITTDGCNSRS